MAETSLSRLQNQVIKLEKENLKLRDLLNAQKERNRALEQQLKRFEEQLQSKIDKAINDSLKELIEENEKLKKDNEHLRRILNNNSDNSGIPTSKTKIGEKKRIPNSREKSDKKKGGQFGHSKHKLEKFKDEEITDTCTHKIEKPICKDCGGKLILTGKRCKDEFDIEIRLVKRRHEFYEYKCSCCGEIIKVPIPDKLKEDNQYGSNAQAIAISLVNEGYASFKRTRELISGFTGGEMVMSEGFIAKLQKRCYDKLSNFDNELHKKLLSEKLIQWDDTSITINGKQGYLRFYGNEKLRYFKAHEHKDKAGIDDDKILPYLSEDTVVVHDHNIVNYNDEYDFTNAECCVHLIRDLIKLNDVLSRDWIQSLIKLLVDTNNKRNEYIDKSIMQFDSEVSDKIIEDYDKLVDTALKINSSDYNPYYGKEEATLIKRLIDYKQNYLLFVFRFDVPFSNNLSERSLRSSKTKMKVSGQFANIQNAEYFARIRSYIETCKANGINPHEAIVRLIEDNPYTLEEIIKD